MKGISRSLAYAVALPLLLAALAAGAPDQAAPFTLLLVAPTQPLKAGQTLVLRVRITNTSNHATNIPITLADPALARGIYHVHVLDEHGRSAPPWIPPPPPRGKAVLRVGMMPGRELGPDETLSDEVNVSRFYYLSRPGRYKIWIAEPYYRGPDVSNGLVKSNTITVTVVR